MFIKQLQGMWQQYQNKYAFEESRVCISKSLLRVTRTLDLQRLSQDNQEEIQ